MTENNNDDRSLIETLVYEGVLPSFDLPTDVALFEAQKIGKTFGKIVAEHSVSKSLSSALNTWTPNRKLVIEKTEYKISGILIPFAEIPENDDSLTPSQQDERKALAKKDRFEWWLRKPGNLKYIHVCTSCRHVLSSDSSPSELDDNEKAILEGEKSCPICNSIVDDSTFVSLPWIQPPGYGPAMDASGRHPDPKSQGGTPSTRSGLGERTIWPMQYSNDDSTTLIPFSNGVIVSSSDEVSRLRQMVAKDIVPEDPDPDVSVLETTGFSICESCGSFNPRGSHPRPYPFSKTLYNDDTVNFTPDTIKSCSGISTHLVLGRSFSSTILSLRIPLGGILIDPIAQADQRSFRNLQKAAFTLGRVLIDELCQFNSFNIDEFDCDVRLYRKPGGDTEHDRFLEVFFFENTSGGSGNLFHINESMVELLNGQFSALETSIEDRLSGNKCLIMVPNEGNNGKYSASAHPCNKACNGCLLDYRNSNFEHRLDRELAWHLWRFVRHDSLNVDDGSILNLEQYLIKIKNYIENKPSTQHLDITPNKVNDKIISVNITDRENNIQEIVKIRSPLLNDDDDDDEVMTFSSDQVRFDLEDVMDEIIDAFD